MKIDPRVTDPDIGWRLRLMRWAKGRHGPGQTNKKTFAAQLHVGYTAYCNYEKGWSVPRKTGDMMMRRIGINPSYLFYGGDDFLTGKQIREIAEAETALSEERPTSFAG